MNQQELNHIIQSPQEINTASASELIALCEKYPWFSTPHTLLAHYFAQTNDFRKDDWLIRSASRIHNREWLFHFIQSENILIDPPAEPAFVPAEESPSEITSPVEEYDIAKAMGTTFNFEPVDIADEKEEIESREAKNYRPYNLEEFLSLGLIQSPEPEEIAENLTLESKEPTEALDFFDWLKLMNPNPSNQYSSKNSTPSGDPSNPANAQEEFRSPEPGISLSFEPVADKSDLIDQFIEKQPSISRPKKEFYSPERAMKRSETFSVGIVTETLAHIFRTQGHFEKAILSYEKLQLKFPEKSAYFASLIEQIKKEQNQ